MRAEMGKDPSRAPPSQLNLPPGFRFYPTDEELVVHYLCKKAASEPFSVPIIAEVELYKFDPWDLPERALFGEKEWYFFSPRDRKYPNGSRPNRAAGTGYWKATGTDKPISTMGKKVGVKKALVFYKGKAPKGLKTNWIMHEYRLADSGARSAKKKGSLRLDDWVLCRIYKKCSSNAVQKAASMKEHSESSCLEDVPSPPKAIDNRLNCLQEGSHMDTKGMASLQSFYHETPDQLTAARNASQLNMYMQQLQGAKPVLELPAEQRHSCINSHDQGTSSWDVSHRESNAYSSRQLSSPEASVQEDDAVDSSFNSMPSFPGSQLNPSFPQSFYGLDAGLLPSPTGMLGGSRAGEAGSFASLLESDLGTLFAPNSEYVNGSGLNHARGFAHDRSSYFNWDPKVNFST